jgi:hypothetical protein
MTDAHARCDVIQISRNNVREENVWAFGQIIPLILLIGPLSDAYDAVLHPFIRVVKEWIGRRTRQVPP